MRIGILTLPLNTNYGGILQAYALQTILERQGYEVHVIDIEQPKHPAYLMPLVYLKRIFNNILSSNKIEVFEEYKRKRQNPIIQQYTRAFLKSNIHSYHIKSLHELGNIYEAIVVGSDQIWRRDYITCRVSKNVLDAFLDFAKSWKIKRLAYAASFGVDEWEFETSTSSIRELAQKFDAISVREDTGVELCYKYLKVSAQHVVDPTMLLDRSDYIQLIENADVPKNRGNLFVYILDETEDKDRLVRIVEREKSLSAFEIHNRNVDNRKLKAENRIQPSVEQWLKGIYDAEFVVTDSFHACVFSIIFGKPFIAYGNIKRGLSRFQSLLKMFGLEKNLIMDSREFDVMYDYSSENVRDGKLAQLKSEGIRYLKTNLQ